MKPWNAGFTLVELMVILAIIAILLAIAVPVFHGTAEKAKKAACDVNCRQLEGMYEAYLISEGVAHTAGIFDKYMQEYDHDICPVNGSISYFNDDVNCSIHSMDQDSRESDDSDENDGKDDGSIPFL